MTDSAKIQEQDAEYYNDRLPPGENPIYPLYTVEDAENCLPNFEPTPYFRHSKQWTRISDRVRVKFYDAGHILGSSVIVLEITENNKTHTLCYTGDLGHENTPLLIDPEIPNEHIDTLISECTYGNRVHRPLEQAREDLAHLIIQATKHKSKIIIPAFSLGRTQELVYVLHQLTDERKIPRIPIYIDSPLAANVTDVFSKHSEEFDKESWQDFGKDGEWPLTFRNLVYTHSIDESKRLNTLSGPFMVISASGMCEGGRILHHLKNNIDNPNNAIVFTGFQAQNTLGRKIIEGMSPVRIYGRQYAVKAQIFKFNEFSAHADQKQLPRRDPQTVCGHRPRQRRR
jgi:metallo-beta-lactamase family protein